MTIAFAWFVFFMLLYLKNCIALVKLYHICSQLLNAYGNKIVDVF